MKIFIEPNDVLMFRDGKPFSGGDDHFARGFFPPTPSTIYGAIRSHILSIKSAEFESFKKGSDNISESIREEIGTPSRSGKMKIREISIAKIEDGSIVQYFPMPRDVVKNRQREEKRLYIMSPCEKLRNVVMSDIDSNLNYLWQPIEYALENASGYLSSMDMERYLTGEGFENNAEPIEAGKVFKTDIRTGIGRNRTKRAVEKGRLYSVEYFRLNDGFGFAVEIENTSLLPEKGIIRLGGDGRSARYFPTSWGHIPFEKIKEKISKTKRFKILLITPAIFKKGWLFDWIDEKTKEGSICGVNLRLVGACVGRPVSVGGFDLAKNLPKVMKRAVPAGSVYYFELKEGKVDSLFDNLWLNSISDEKSEEGFGIILIGGF